MSLFHTFNSRKEAHSQSRCHTTIHTMFCKKLPDHHKHCVDKVSSSFRAVVHSLRVQWALQDVLQAAKAKNQLILGVHRAAEELATDRSQIGLCVLVDNPHTDPGVHVHCRLIEAFCWESFIPVIKVTDAGSKPTPYCNFFSSSFSYHFHFMNRG